ncbi:hypothetical protein JMM61_19400 [Rhodovulum sulfidophilum]|uniref:hypothetical protein n=1 Tax=Rhodovulum sulfidophilum TaxID=35806 RepID=UPI001928935B|nr:hypothetical protein [Rhodovulum sulfidophilum]MBL3587508.1 hypothetical protein [Rhodovulum sulfidophilum]
MINTLREALFGETLELDWSKYQWLDKFLSGLPTNPDTMAHSAAYFLHTGRKGLYLVRRQKYYALVAAHPNIENTALVLPAGGSPAPELWHDLCLSISEKGLNASLGRVPDTLAQLVESRDEFKLVVERKLDWRYPVTVVDNRKLSKLNGGEYSHYRRKIRRATSRGAICIVDQLSPTYAELEEPVLRMIERWARTVSAIKDFDVEHLISSNLSAYRLGFLKKYQINCRVYLSSGGVIGLCATELKNSGNTANGIAMCVDRSWTGCSEFMYWTEANELLRQGYLLYNINGSETQSLNEFRSKLRPTDQIPLHTYQLRN